MEQSHLRPVDAPGEQPPPGGSNPSKRKPQRARPSKSLPTDRMRFDVQVRVLDVTARISSVAKRAVSEKVIAPAISDVSHYTVMLSHNFFVDMGWLDKKGRGEYAATEVLVQWSLRKTNTPNDLPAAVAPLRETAIEAWPWKAIAPILSAGPAQIGSIVTVLMNEAGAGADYRPHVMNLLEWLQYINLVRITDGMVAAVNSSDTAIPEVRDEPADGGAVVEVPVIPAGTTVPKPTTETPGVPGVVSRATVLAVTFTVNFTADDLAKLSPDQISALFGGVGEVVSAKAATT